MECNHDGSCDKIRICCTRTEMTLTQEDAERIDALGYSRDDYLERMEDGFCELKNVDEYCYFYNPESNECVIYESRPEGCRYYPIVYDVRKGKCVVDRDCPSWQTVTREDIQRVCHKVKKLVEQLMLEAEYNRGPC